MSPGRPPSPARPGLPALSGLPGLSGLSGLRHRHGPGLPRSIEELHHAENELVVTLRHLADRHRVDHEVRHVGLDVARWSAEHVRRLAETGRDHGLDLDPEPATEPAPLARLRRAGSELTGRRSTPAVVLLADLREVHRLVAGVSLDWEVLAQCAQATRDARLLALAADCHPQTLRQLRWTNEKVKESAAQAIVAGPGDD